MNKLIKDIKHIYRVKKSVIREKSKSKKRSPQWDDIRDKYLELNPTCAACGSKEKLQVHHIIPFNINPDLELDTNNLITLCMSLNECHLNLGHCDNFSLFNPNIVFDANLFLNSNIQERILLQENIKKNAKKPRKI